MVEPASLGSSEYAKTDAAVDSLADALADPEATADTEIDVPEALGLQEAETDTVLDKTSPTDALYGVTCTSFDDEKLGAPRRQRRGVHEAPRRTSGRVPRPAAAAAQGAAGDEVRAAVQDPGRLAAQDLGGARAAGPVAQRHPPGSSSLLAASRLHRRASLAAGTGKTACFVLGMLKAVVADPGPQALCLSPTRELAKQIGAWQRGCR